MSASGFSFRRTIVFFGFCIACFPFSNQGAPLPNPASVASDSEQAAAQELLRISETSYGSPEEMLAPLNALLARLDRPSALRGLVQYFRASTLRYTARNGEAVTAIDEAVRSLPGQSMPLALASRIHSLGDRPDLATDYLLRASRADPDLVRAIGRNDLFDLVMRLRQNLDRARLSRLAERLFDIGWIGTDANLRSSLAEDLIQARVRSGDLDGARAALPHLLAPGDARGMLASNTYRAIWPDIERWTGPRQETQWQSYLGEIQAAWEASGDPQTTLAYAQALRSAGHDRTLLARVLPLFDDIDGERDYELVWGVSVVAGVLVRQGRTEDARGLFERASRAWPLGSDANALNIAANRYAFELENGNPAVAFRGIEAAIADANGRAGVVSSGTLAMMHVTRACALEQLGRREEAQSSINLVISTASPQIRLPLLLCLDRLSDAQTMLAANLEDANLRDAVIEYFQPDPEQEIHGAYAQMMDERGQRLRQNPVLRAHVARYGRILSYTGRDGAPPEENRRPLDPIPVV